MTTDFRSLVEEALQSAYDPRARRCRPWSHEWTMWLLSPDNRKQSRRCVGCGKTQFKTVAKECLHSWSILEQRDVWLVGADRPSAVAYFQSCRWCGDVRRREV